MGRGLSHVALRTRDIKETERFYTQVLGIKVAFRVGPDMIFLRTPGSRDLLNFIESTKRISGIQALDHIGFKITQPELKRIEKRLKENGVKIEGRRGRNQSIFWIRTGIRSNIIATEFNNQRFRCADRLPADYCGKGLAGRISGESTSPISSNFRTPDHEQRRVKAVIMSVSKRLPEIASETDANRARKCYFATLQLE